MCITVFVLFEKQTTDSAINTEEILHFDYYQRQTSRAISVLSLDKSRL